MKRTITYHPIRKKYMKIRAQFNRTMNDNHTLWEDEQKLTKTARRLEEELECAPTSIPIHTPSRANRTP
jgi:hypothetical protein